MWQVPERGRLQTATEILHGRYCPVGRFENVWGSFQLSPHLKAAAGIGWVGVGGGMPSSDL